MDLFDVSVSFTRLDTLGFLWLLRAGDEPLVGRPFNTLTHLLYPGTSRFRENETETETETAAGV